MPKSIPFLAAALLLSAGLAAPARTECLGYVVLASGKPINFLDRPVDEKAEASAIAAWEALTAFHAGKAFAKWKNADGGKVECWLPNRSTTQCKAIARPCDGRE